MQQIPTGTCPNVGSEERIQTFDLTPVKDSSPCKAMNYKAGDEGMLLELSSWLTRFRDYLRGRYPKLGPRLADALIKVCVTKHNEFTQTHPSVQYNVTVGELELPWHLEHVMSQITTHVLGKLPAAAKVYAESEATKRGQESRLIDGLFRTYQLCLPSCSTELDEAREFLEKKRPIKPHEAALFLYDFEIKFLRLEALGVYIKTDNLSVLHSTLKTAVSAGYHGDFLHDLRTWKHEHPTPVRVPREYLILYLNCLKGLVGSHYRAKQSTPVAEPKPKANPALQRSGGGRGGGGGGGQGNQPGICTRCIDKVNHGQGNQCPHIGQNLTCSHCNNPGHDENACWKKHPALFPPSLAKKQRKGKGKGKGGGKGRQGNGDAPAGGARRPQ